MAKESELKAAQNENESLKVQLDELKVAHEELKSSVKEWGISDRDQAFVHIKENYKVPSTVKRILVVQDGCVFYDGDIGSGDLYAKEKNYKKFTFGNVGLENEK